MYAAGWFFVNYVPVGGDDNHVLCIGLAGLGIVMLFNVGIIWPNNKKIIRATLAGAPREDAAKLARSIFGITDKLLSFGPYAVLHGRRFAFLEHGDFRQYVTLSLTNSYTLDPQRLVDAGTMNSSEAWPSDTMFCRESSRLLPFMSGSARWWSSSTATKPGVPPLGDTSTRPSARPVASTRTARGR